MSNKTKIISYLRCAKMYFWSEFGSLNLYRGDSSHGLEVKFDFEVKVNPTTTTNTSNPTTQLPNP